MPADTATLSLTLQWTPLAVVSNIWHVLDVPARSPAEAAGLLPYGDYVLGTAEGTLHGEAALGELVEDHIGRPLRLYVYNHEYDVAREVAVTPSRDWGGEGALGCVLGYGALHRLPPPLSEPVDAPGETMFDGGSAAAGGAGPGDPAAFAAYGYGGAVEAPPPADAPGPAANGAPAGGEFLVPAQMVKTAAAPVARGKKKDRHAHRGGPGLMDDYLKEEEQKSRELDNPSSGRHTPVAPPPKGAGGPPKGPPPPPRAETPKKDDDGDDGVD